MSPKEAVTPTGANQWKKSKQQDPVEVPSGNHALIRRKPLQVFVKAGLIPNDLLPIIKNAMKNGKVEITSDEIMDSPAMIAGTLELIDVIVCESVVDPKVYPAPLKEEDRDEEKLYVDDVDWEDKRFIYEYVLGAVADVEAFREKQEGDVEAVPDGELVTGTAI